jgi:hypothetical protein
MDAMFERVEDLAELVFRTVTPLADLSNGYALLDFPDYSNVGDSLIWLERGNPPFVPHLLPALHARDSATGSPVLPPQPSCRAGAALPQPAPPSRPGGLHLAKARCPQDREAAP